MDRLIPILLKGIGVVALAISLVAAYYGPLEIFVFDFFSPGGRFYYEGFGFGSFWFAALVAQNLGLVGRFGVHCHAGDFVYAILFQA